MNLLKIIMKNISYSFLAQIIIKVSTAILTIYIARELGQNTYGLYNFSISFIALFSLISEFGISTLLTREIAQNSKVNIEYISTSFLLKLIFTFLMIFIISVLVSLSNYTIIEKIVILMLAIISSINSISSFFIGIINGFQDMKFSALSSILERCILFIVGLTYLLNDGELIGYILISIITACIQLVYLHFIVVKKYGIKIKLNKINIKTIKKILLNSLPLGITAYIIIIYYKADIVMLGLMKSNIEVAIYSVAYMLINFLSFIPSTLMSVLFPFFSNLYKSDFLRYTNFINKAFKILFVIAFPLSVVVTVTAPKIVQIFFGNSYGDSILPLQILIWTVSFMFFNSFLGNLMVIEGNAIKNTIVVTCTAIINIFLNFVLIPKYSIIGASISTVIAEMIPTIIIIYFRLISTRINFYPTLVFKLLTNIIISAVILLLLNSFNVFLQSLLSLLVFTINLFLLKILNLKEIKLFLYNMKYTKVKI